MREREERKEVGGGGVVGGGVVGGEKPRQTRKGDGAEKGQGRANHWRRCVRARVTQRKRAFEWMIIFMQVQV